MATSCSAQIKTICSVFNKPCRRRVRPEAGHIVWVESRDVPVHGSAAGEFGSRERLQVIRRCPRYRSKVHAQEHIITSSYEGEPLHNAAHLTHWIQTLGPGVMTFRHSDWVHTFQKVPKLIDSTLETLGASILAPLHSTNAKDRDTFSDFEAWEDDVLWPSVLKRFAGPSDAGGNSAPGLRVSFSTPRASVLHQSVEEAMVVAARRLVDQSGGNQEKRHVELRLPANMPYSAGDYLAVLPHNPKESVHESSGSRTSSYVELGQMATKRDLATLCEMNKEGDEILQLQKLADEEFDTVVKKGRLSVLDVLEKFPALCVPIHEFLQMLPPMRLRQYQVVSMHPITGFQNG
ncbi:hypothetical protein J3459_017001 [Metarhizium acridum]|nr:hypothetical protein J3459_017001 [Metarhizium acridum]